MSDEPESEGIGADSSAGVEADSLLRALAAAPPRALPGERRESAPLKVGTLVDGTFRIESTLGEGAMGVVYLATDVTLDRSVALKLHNSANDDPRASRMWREAKAMARLSHPNVVTVHEVGVFDGRVYIAMEQVTGGTLREWLETPRTWREVVDAFAQAGEGLAAAHRVDLVHRDFKPSNALIGDDGRVRVADFGLARAALDDDTEGATVSSVEAEDSPSLEDRLTRTGVAVGTPAYMSPEQLNGLRVDHRADQYAFCVALYEGLYGVRPYRARSIPELVVAVSTGELPVPPADREVPAWVRAIVVRGLSPSPGDRFASMDGLLEALRRDPTVRRRVATGAVAGAVTLGGLLFAVSHASSDDGCSTADTPIRDAWSPERAQAVRAAIDATGLAYATDTAARVEVGLDAYADAWSTMAVRACEHGDAELSAQLRDAQVLCLERRRRAMDAAVGVLEGIDATQLRKAVNVIDRLPAVSVCGDVEFLSVALELPAAPETSDAVDDLRQRLDQAKALDDAGSYDEGLRQAATIVEQARDAEYTPVLAEALFRQGQLAEHAGKYEDANDLLREAYAEAVSCAHEEVATDAALALLHLVGVRLAKHEAGLEWELHARAHGRRIRFVDGREGTLENALGAVQQERGKFDLAFAHFERAREIWGAELPETDLRQSRIYNNLGGVERRRHNLQEADRWFTRALEFREERLGPDHPLVSNALMGLGNVAFLSGERPLAIERYQRALAIREAAVGPDHPQVAELLSNLGIFLQYEGKFEESLRVQQRALRIEIAAKGEEHPSVATSVENIGSVHFARGQYDEAIEAYERALRIREKTLGKDHVNLSTVLGNLAMVHEERGQLDDALALHERALELKRAHLDPTHPQVSNALESVGNVHFRKGAYEEALALYQEAFEIRSQAHEPDHPDMLLSHANIGNALEMQERFDEALESHRKALGVANGLAEADPKRGLALFNMGQVHRMRGEGREALPHLRRALELRTTHDTPAALIADTRFELAQALRLAGEDDETAQREARAAREAYASLNLVVLRDSVDAWLDAKAP